jgi:ferritin-like metal-binding protein YciE
LRSLLLSHAQLNGNQIVEIAAILERQGESSGNDKCMAMAGLIEEGTARLERAMSHHTRDLMLVTLCRRIGRFEMAAYEITTLLSGRLGLMREPLVLSELLANERDMASALIGLEPGLFERASSIA